MCSRNMVKGAVVRGERRCVWESLYIISVLLNVRGSIDWIISTPLIMSGYEALV